MKLLEGKTALVTGGARGIGKAICIKLAENGANIAFTDIVEDNNFKNTLKESENLGIKIKGYISDAGKFDDSQKVIDEIINEISKNDGFKIPK